MDKLNSNMSRRKLLSSLATVAFGAIAGGTGFMMDKRQATYAASGSELSGQPQPIVNVRDYGAKGDGQNDDSDALQAAIDAAARGGRVVFIPQGRYRTTKTLQLPSINRPNTAGTQGSGFKIYGAGMYDSGIIYSGTSYALYSSQNTAEAMLFQDFYINHAKGGGICLPQGAHQMFERFFSSACGEGKYGLYIQGNRDRETMKGYGAYVVSLKNCRFWSETGYRGTGVRLEDILLCTTIDSCFFSTLKGERSHLEVVRCNSVNITGTAFERVEEPAVKAPLVRLQNSNSISIQECHAEAYFEAFVGIYENTSNVVIDGCRTDHYAIKPYNTQRGLMVAVDPQSKGSKNIFIGPRNTHVQSNHPDTVHGSIISDPIGCVTVKGFLDTTPYANNFQYTERRTVPTLGETGINLFPNPALLLDGPNGVPINLKPSGGSFTFRAVKPSGCIVKQGQAGSQASFLSFQLSESLSKYDRYTLFLVGRNLSGTSFSMFVDAGKNIGSPSVIWPSGNEKATLTLPVPKVESSLIRLIAYTSYEVEFSSIYLVPNQTMEAPYGSEVVAASRLNLGREMRYGSVAPTEAGGAVGEIVFNLNPVAGGSIGWVYTAAGWKEWGKINP